MLTGFLPAPCSLWALSKEMPQNSASFKWICRSGRSVFFWACDFTTITDAAHCSAAAVGPFVFVRHLRWAWFEFSCHDSHKHLHEMSVLGLWICCPMGLNYHMCWNHLFHIFDSGHLLYCVSEQYKEICSLTLRAHCSLPPCRASHRGCLH